MALLCWLRKATTRTNTVCVAWIRQPPIKVLGTLKGVVYLRGGSVFATSAGAVLGGRTSVQGTKEWEFCSSRGDCNFGSCSLSRLCCRHEHPFTRFRCLICALVRNRAVWVLH
jgi:hypothetical protein